MSGVGHKPDLDALPVISLIRCELSQVVAGRFSKAKKRIEIIDLRAISVSR
jgi:hypothetical protein